MARTTPSRFRIDLGINLLGATITGTNPNSRLFPLQHGLVDVTNRKKPKPAWYTRFRPGDRLSARLVDISSFDPSDPLPPYPGFAVLKFFLTRRDFELSLASDPFEEAPRDWKISNRPEFRPSPVYSRSSDLELPTWKLFYLDEAGKRRKWVTFAEQDGGEEVHAFELSVLIAARRGGRVDQFILDPEIIVSGTGQ